MTSVLSLIKGVPAVRRAAFLKGSVSKRVGYCSGKLRKALEKAALAAPPFAKATVDRSEPTEGTLWNIGTAQAVAGTESGWSEAKPTIACRHWEQSVDNIMET